MVYQKRKELAKKEIQTKMHILQKENEDYHLNDSKFHILFKFVFIDQKEYRTPSFHHFEKLLFSYPLKFERKYYPILAPI